MVQSHYDMAPSSANVSWTSNVICLVHVQCKMILLTEWLFRSHTLNLQIIPVSDRLWGARCLYHAIMNIHCIVYVDGQAHVFNYLHPSYAEELNKWQCIDAAPILAVVGQAYTQGQLLCILWCHKRLTYTPFPPNVHWRWSCNCGQ